MDMARVLWEVFEHEIRPGGAEDLGSRHGMGVTVKLIRFVRLPSFGHEGHGLAFEAVDLVIADKLFRAMRSLLFSLSNSASSLGTRFAPKANLIKEASSQRSWAWELDRFSSS